MLHILITCLDVVFNKTCVYTCTTSEPHLIIIFCAMLLICTH